MAILVRTIKMISINCKKLSPMIKTNVNHHTIKIKTIFWIIYFKGVASFGIIFSKWEFEGVIEGAMLTWLSNLL